MPHRLYIFLILMSAVLQGQTGISTSGAKANSVYVRYSNPMPMAGQKLTLHYAHLEDYTNTFRTVDLSTTGSQQQLEELESESTYQYYLTKHCDADTPHLQSATYRFTTLSRAAEQEQIAELRSITEKVST